MLNKIKNKLNFDVKIQGVTDDELGIYETKNKELKINVIKFAKLFINKFEMIKVGEIAKSGKENLINYICGINHWVKVDRDIIKSLIREFLSSYGVEDLGNALEGSIAKEIMSLGTRVEDVDTYYYMMNLKDCTFNFKTCKFEAQNSKKYFIDAKEFTIGEMKIDTPIFDKFMLDIMDGDTEAVEFLLQYMGSCISGIQMLEKFTLLKGNGSNGKSTLIKLLNNIIGDRYVETRDISKLDDRFAMQGLDKAKLLVSAESSNKRVVSTETIKKLTTKNEKIYMDIKNEEAKTVVLNLNLIFACNQPVHFSEIEEGDNAIIRRLVVIPFNRMFKEHEKDRELDEKLKLEISGITLKLIEAYIRLANNKYILPKSELIENETEDYKEKYLYKKEPMLKIKNFIDMYLERDESYIMSIGHMYEKFQEKTNDINMKEQTFAKEIRLAMPEKDKKDPSKKGKEVLDKQGETSTRYFVGFKLRETPKRKQMYLSNNLEDVI